MAQPIQIIPKFLHSHVETVINDYTEFTETVSSVADDSVRFLSVFLGPKGVDNTLVKVNDLNTFEKMFGRSDYALYGQPMMMAEAELRSSYASCWCMRVMPDDAKYANSVLSIYYKADVAKKKFRIKFKAKALSGGSAVTSKADMVVKGRTLDGSAVSEGIYKDSDGYTQVPAVTFRATGRGKYGNSLRWRIVRSKDSENDYRIKMFRFETLEAGNGLNTTAIYRGSVVESPKFSYTTLINDVLDDAEVGIAPVDIQVYEDNMLLLYNEYIKFLQQVQEANPGETIMVPDIDEFDMFFALGVGVDTKDKYISFTMPRPSVVDPSADADDFSDDAAMITVDNIEGTSLAGGSDGKFEDPDPNERDKAVIAAYKKAFNGTYDTRILANKRTPVDAIFDANYPYEVKKELVALTLMRNDALLYLDCGLVQSFSVAQQQKLIEDYGIFNNRAISKNPQWYLIKDPVTRKKVPVTITYYFAQQYARHLREAGNHTPFANTYAQLSGHVKNSLMPVIEEHELTLKEWLYTNRFNYFEALADNEFRRSSQNTAQGIYSDLLEENNMSVLFEIKHILEVDAREGLYNFAEANDRKRFREYEEAKFANWIGRKVQSFDIDFRMNEWEAERSILHCYVAVQFRTLNKRTIIEIDVNKRDFTI